VMVAATFSARKALRGDSESDPGSARKAPAMLSFPFYRDVLHATQMEDGRVFVSLKRLCEALGIDFRT